MLLCCLLWYRSDLEPLSRYQQRQTTVKHFSTVISQHQSENIARLNTKANYKPTLRINDIMPNQFTENVVNSVTGC